MCLFIGAVCAFDNTLNVITARTLVDMEENSVALMVIDRAGVVGLVELKAIGALLAVAVSLTVIQTKYRIAVHAVATVQLALLLYLCFAIDMNQPDAREALCSDPLLIPRLVFDFYVGE